MPSFIRKYILVLLIIIIISFVAFFSFSCESLAQKADNSPFGVVASPAKNRSFGRDPKATISWLKELGVKWVRVHFAWKKIEPLKGKMSSKELNRYDDIIKSLKDENFNVVLLLGGVPSWSGINIKNKKKRKAKGIVPSEENLSYIVEFIVTRYKDKIQHYQILNETTLPAHWTEPEKFAALMKAAYQTAKKSVPKCKVIMGGFGTRSIIPKTEYLERFIKAGGADSVDIFDFHMYNYISRLFTDIPTLKKVLKENKIEKPIWILETGDPSNFTNLKVIERIAKRDIYQEQGPWDWPIFDEEEQARRLVKRMTLALSEGIEKIFWYSFQDRLSIDKVDPNDKSSGHKNTKGLLYTDFTPKKSFYAYKFLISTLSNTQFKKRLHLGCPNCMGYLFKNDKKSILILWNWENSAEIELEMHSEKIEVYDTLGRSKGFIKAKNGNKFHIMLTPDPLYIIRPVH